ncbi:MAG: phosphotransferase [Acidobacteria bacterium]|nr:phosphotransferase [Acidobacteriota bacterium]
MNQVNSSELQSRFAERVLVWRIRVESVSHTPSSIIAFGRRDEQPVVPKVVKGPGDEWLSGRVVDAFASRGVVQALEHIDGAVLLERLLPGKPLANGTIPDAEATAIIGDVIDRMSPGPPPSTVPTVELWGKGFERHLRNGTPAIPRSLVEAAHRPYMEMCASQQATRLLHGDLHHQHVLLDAERGWLAIDPKGVVGELAYEVGASLRNPCEQPELFATPARILERVDCFERVLRLDRRRILAWTFAQAVLAAIWELEDDGAFSAGAGWISLASAIRSML